MREQRNFLLTLVLGAALIWAFVAWAVLGDSLFRASTALWVQRWASLLLAASCGSALACSMLLEDRMPDNLSQMAGPFYYETDGLCFLPVVRMGRDGQAELSIYYQNRFDSPVAAVVHLRPPMDSFVIRPGMRDAHFAFRADGGDFGVIRQPIAVPRHLQGEIVNVQLAAASYYPRGKGARLRSRKGLPCGSLHVDWGGSAFKTGVHEVSGEIELRSPTTLHLCMPEDAAAGVAQRHEWKQERLVAGMAT